MIQAYGHLTIWVIAFALIIWCAFTLGARWQNPNHGLLRDPLRVLKERLDGYASLAKPDQKHWRGYSKDNVLLTGEQQQILLGTLKKIEGKNSNLFVAIVFFETIIFTAAPILSKYAPLEIKHFLVLSLCLAPALFMSLLGNRHLDNWHLKLSNEHTQAAELQAGLLNDLLLKERLFKASWSLTLLVALAFFVTVILALHSSEQAALAPCPPIAYTRGV